VPSVCTDGEGPGSRIALRRRTTASFVNWSQRTRPHRPSMNSKRGRSSFGQLATAAWSPVANSRPCPGSPSSNATYRSRRGPAVTNGAPA